VHPDPSGIEAMHPPSLYRVLARGGTLSPAQLLRIVEASRSAGGHSLTFGARQEVLFRGGDDRAEIERHLDSTGLGWDRVLASHASASRHDGPVSWRPETDQPRHNVVSSHVSIGVTTTTWWLGESTYQRILESFAVDPGVAVNLVDPLQGLVPLLTGHLNFVATPEEEYWHLYLRPGDRDDGVLDHPLRVHSDEIAALTATIENRTRRKGRNRMPNRERKHPQRSYRSGPNPRRVTGGSIPVRPVPFPCYAGLHSMPGSPSWLGLHRKDHHFRHDLLRSVARLCHDTGVRRIGITPWKSLVIRGMPPRDRDRWERLTRQHATKPCTSPPDLGWHVPTMDSEALELRATLIEKLREKGVNTQGLTFGITGTGSRPFTSIVIEREGRSGGEPGSYSIRHAEAFDPNRLRYRSHERGVPRERLAPLLAELIRSRHGSSSHGARGPLAVEPAATAGEKLVVHPRKAVPGIADLESLDERIA